MHVKDYILNRHDIKKSNWLLLGSELASNMLHGGSSRPARSLGQRLYVEIEFLLPDSWSRTTKKTIVNPRVSFFRGYSLYFVLISSTTNCHVRVKSFWLFAPTKYTSSVLLHPTSYASNLRQMVARAWHGIVFLLRYNPQLIFNWTKSGCVAHFWC